MPLVFEQGPKQPISVPDFEAFSGAFNQDPAYNRVRVFSDDQVSAARLETFLISKQYELDHIVLFWNKTLTGVPESAKPTSDEIAVWNDICTQTEMPFAFDDQGFLA